MATYFIRLVMLALGLAFAAAPALAQSGARQPAVQTIFSGEATCQLAAGETKEQAQKRCFSAARVRLWDNAAVAMEKSFAAKAKDLTREDYRALAAGALSPEIAAQEFSDASGKATVSVAVRAATDVETITDRVAQMQAHPELRQKLAEGLKAAGQSAPPAKALAKAAPQAAAQPDSGQTADFSQAETQRKKIMGEMRASAESAAKNIRPGMTDAQVRTILGEPGTFKLGDPTFNFMCLGYGGVFVVLENGLAACLRTRLEYVKAYQSDCHCAGMLTNFIPFALDEPQDGSGPKPRAAQSKP